MDDAKRAKPPPSRLEGVRTGVDVGKSLFALLRDSLIFLLLILLLIWPGAVQDRLRRAGVKTADLGFMKLEVEASQRDSIAALSDVDATREAAARVLEEARRNPALRPLVPNIERWVASLTSASARLDRSTMRQQQVIEQAGPAAPAQVEGWVSLNFVNLDGPRRPGARGVTHTRPLRVRGESNSQSRVVAVLPIGTSVEIREINRNFAKVVQR